MDGDEGSMDNHGGDVIIINNNNNNDNCSDNDNAKRCKREIVEDGGSLSPLQLQHRDNGVYLRHRQRNDRPDEPEEEDLRQSDDEVRVADARSPIIYCDVTISIIHDSSFNISQFYPIPFLVHPQPHNPSMAFDQCILFFKFL